MAARQDSLAREFIAGEEVGQNRQMTLVLRSGNTSIFKEVLYRRAMA